MPSFKWSSRDLKQLKSLGIRPTEASRQLELFRRPPPFTSLDRPAHVGDGILELKAPHIRECLSFYEKARRKGRFMKFVPASGAASRMFQLLAKFRGRSTLDLALLKEEASRGVEESRQFLSLMGSLDRLAFWPELETALVNSGHQPSELRREGKFAEILSVLLSEDGLDYSRKPKALIRFHTYPSGGRSALEEHLVEGVGHVADASKKVAAHFTFSNEHLRECRALLSKALKQFSNSHRVRFKVGSSIQSPSTDTLAADPDNNPFRDELGRLVFRPGGHGALLYNLARLKGDLVFVKNIDNVLPEYRLGSTLHWKKVLGGKLALVQEEVYRHLKKLSAKKVPTLALEGAATYARNDLLLDLGEGFGAFSNSKKTRALKALLDRPVRVCGVVPNTGEPGGGPFWVRKETGELSLQIVESAQVDMGSQDQSFLFKSSSHFNPVDLVCGLRGFKGKPFNLRKFRDERAVFISHKSQGGKELKALELPGLWNGAMAGWITIFVEVPLETFNPVKTVLDLLKPAHQPKV